nr:glycosyltransferase family 4 protein [uncultured Lachnoclostridium sp.]
MKVVVNIQKKIVDLAYKYKSVILRIFPKTVLKEMKSKLILFNIKKLSKVSFIPFKRDVFPDGVNLIGSIKAETGLGQSCRLLANEIMHTKLPFTIYDYESLGEMSLKDNSYDEYISDETKYNINLVHINPRELGIALVKLDKGIWDKRYNIGFWLWELEEFPEEWIPFIDYFDEIWTPSEFISRSIRKCTKKPVITIPYSIETSIDKACGRQQFKLPEEQFLFLMMFDYNSVAERKNPVGMIEAFKRAFSPEKTNVGLVIKVTSANENDINDLRSKLFDYKNIYFITSVLEKQKVNSLINCVDVVVSLHRAEGFGLVMAEAMSLGTPTIATNWSSNTEFMNNDVACMVDYKMIELSRDIGPFKKGQRWADADIEQAADYMKRLVADKKYYDEIKANAQKHVNKVLGMEHIKTLIEQRVEEIYYKS